MKFFVMPHKTRLTITDIKSVIRGKNSGPAVALIEELDSAPVSDRPHADSEIGYNRHVKR